MTTIKLIPDFVKTFYDEKNIRAVPYSWERPRGYDWLFYLTDFGGGSIFQKNFSLISRYLGINKNQDLSETYKSYLNPVELIQSKGLLDFPHLIKTSSYGASILFNDKELGLQFIKKLNSMLEEEYRSLEDRVRVSILLGGENEQDYAASNIIVTSKYLLNHFNSEFEVNYFFRTLELVSITKQSAHAIEAYVRFYTEICGQCHLCGRSLEDEFSQKVGIGPVCCKTKLKIKKTNVEDIVEVSNKIKSFAEKIGVIGPVLIPKAQISKLK